MHRLTMVDACLIIIHYSAKYATLKYRWDNLTVHIIRVYDAVYDIVYDRPMISFNFTRLKI